MLHVIMTKPVDITYVKKHDTCFDPMKDCLFIDYIIIVLIAQVMLPMLQSQMQISHEKRF